MADQELHVDVEGRTLRISNLAKVMYPSTGTTKGEVLNYYAQIAPVLLPHLKDRAVTRIRWPHGVDDMSFFEKNIPGGTPSWVHTVTVRTHEGVPPGVFFSKKDFSPVPCGQRIRVTARSARCGSIAGATWA